jgi:glutaredoxin
MNHVKKFIAGGLVCGCLAVPIRHSMAQSIGDPPPDVKALMEIERIAEPARRLEALEKFTTEFPDSRLLQVARRATLQVLTHNFADQAERIERTAQEIVRMYPEETGLQVEVARELADAGLALDLAVRIVRDVVSRFTYEKFVAVIKDRAQKTGRPMLPDVALQQQFSFLRVNYQGRLGVILIKSGQETEGERALLEALALSPDLPAEYFSCLAGVAQRRGDDRGALEYWLGAAVSGNLEPEHWTQLEILYEKVHGPSQDARERIEKELDRRHKERFPLPVIFEPYRSGSKRTDRIVLAEVFTGAGCPPCVAAHLALEAAMQRYSTQELLVLMYHMHIPRPDPLTNPSGLARASTYGVRSVPNVFIDGAPGFRGGGGRSMSQDAFDRIDPLIARRLESRSEASVRLQVSGERGKVRVKATVDRLIGRSDQLKLYLLLVENEVRYSGENGIRLHAMVVRDVAGADAGGFPLKAGEPSAVEHEFDLAATTASLKAYLDDYEVNGPHGRIAFRQKKHQLDPAGLTVVAFIQDEADGRILQAASEKAAITASAN